MHWQNKYTALLLKKTVYFEPVCIQQKILILCFGIFILEIIIKPYISSILLVFKNVYVGHEANMEVLIAFVSTVCSPKRKNPNLLGS